MKKILIIITCLLLSVNLLGQTPDKISYQAVIRDAGQNIMANQAIGMRISILQGAVNGPIVYSETHDVISSSNGLVTANIGDGMVSTGNFNSIDWAIGPYYIKTETDPYGGTNYSNTGVSQVLSVPYALYAKTSGSSTPGPAGADGLSAYQIWLSQGNSGTEADFIASLQGMHGINGIDGINGFDGPQGPQGDPGPPGIHGSSAYEIWLNQGNSGTEADFIASLQGMHGINGSDGINGLDGPQGPQGDPGPPGANGSSAYEIWLNQGHTGTEADFIASLQGSPGMHGINGMDGINGLDGPQGPQGDPGASGADGLSAYQIWLNQGNSGSESDFIASLQGQPGMHGINGADGINGLDGPQGPQGEPGPPGPMGPQGPTGPQGSSLVQSLTVVGDSIVLSDGGGIIPSGVQQLDHVLSEGTNAGAQPILNTSQIAIGTASPSNGAALEVNSTTGAVLFPRMNSSQRDAINAENGMVIYNTESGKFQGYAYGQSSIEGTGQIAGIGHFQDETMGQTITTSAAGRLASIKAEVAISINAGDILVNIYDSPNGALLTSSINAVHDPDPTNETYILGQWNFNNIDLIAGTTYYIEFITSSGDPIQVKTSNSDIYAGGMHYRGSSGNVSVAGSGEFDLNFILVLESLNWYDLH